jgi:hypothetical protein
MADPKADQERSALLVEKLDKQIDAVALVGPDYLAAKAMVHELRLAILASALADPKDDHRAAPRKPDETHLYSEAMVAQLQRERDEARRERDELRAAILPNPVGEWTQEGFVNLAKAHQQDSERCDELQDEYGSITAGWRANAETRPLLPQVLSNLQALEAEMRTVLGVGCIAVSPPQFQCWVDKLGTVIADLQEVK